MKPLTVIALLVVSAALRPVSAQRILTLEESTRLALHNNVRIKNSTLETEAARQVRAAAFTSFFPSISAGGSMFRAQKELLEVSTGGGNLPVYDGDPVNLLTPTQFAYFPSSVTGMLKTGTIGTLTAVQPLFAGGRIWNGNKLAALGEEVSEYKERLSRNDVILSTHQQYWQIVSLREKAKTVRAYEEMLDELLRQVEDAYNSGVVMRNDVLKVRLKKSEVQLNTSAVENGIRIAEMSFCQHMGIPYDSALVFADSLEITDTPQSYVVDHSLAIESRAEYRLLQAAVRAEELQTKMKLGEYLPQVGVGVSGLYMKMDNAKDKTVGMVFGTVSVPLSGWWEAFHVLSERSVEEEITANKLMDSREQLLLQMEKAWQDVTEAHRQVFLCEQSKAQAEENAAVNRESYRNGLIAVADLLEAQAMLQTARDHLVAAKAQYAVMRIAYLQLTGR
ncbi:MAG: TolC family protein [Bacteroidetes bacterium]|nr:TolC family protein [Bacteroidota bacterium]